MQTVKELWRTPTAKHFTEIQEEIALNWSDDFFLRTAKQLSWPTNGPLSINLPAGKTGRRVAIYRGPVATLIIPDIAQTYDEVIIRVLPFGNGFVPHQLHMALVNSLATELPVVLLPAPTGASRWHRFSYQARASLKSGKLDLPVGEWLMFRAWELKQIHGVRQHFAYDGLLKVHIHGWSMGGMLALAIGQALRDRPYKYDLQSVIVGGLPNVIDRSPLQLMRDFGRTGPLELFEMSEQNHPQYTRLQGIKAENVFKRTSMMRYAMASVKDHLPERQTIAALVRAMSKDTLYTQLYQMLGRQGTPSKLHTVRIVIAERDAVSPSAALRKTISGMMTHLNDGCVMTDDWLPVHCVDANHTYGDFLPWAVLADHTIDCPRS